MSELYISPANVQWSAFKHDRAIATAFIGGNLRSIVITLHEDEVDFRLMGSLESVKVDYLLNSGQFKPLPYLRGLRRLADMPKGEKE